MGRVVFGTLLAAVAYAAYEGLIDLSPAWTFVQEVAGWVSDR